MRDEAVAALHVRPEGLYVDSTFGRGGHSRAILARLGSAGRLIALDRDPEAIAAAAMVQDKRLEAVHAPFAQLASVLRARGVEKVDGVLLVVSAGVTKRDYVLQDGDVVELSI